MKRDLFSELIARRHRSPLRSRKTTGVIDSRASFVHRLPPRSGISYALCFSVALESILHFHNALWTSGWSALSRQVHSQASSAVWRELMKHETRTHTETIRVTQKVESEQAASPAVRTFAVPALGWRDHRRSDSTDARFYSALRQIETAFLIKDNLRESYTLLFQNFAERTSASSAWRESNQERVTGFIRDLLLGQSHELHATQQTFAAGGDNFTFTHSTSGWGLRDLRREVLRTISLSSGRTGWRNAVFQTTLAAPATTPFTSAARAGMHSFREMSTLAPALTFHYASLPGHLNVAAGGGSPGSITREVVETVQREVQTAVAAQAPLTRFTHGDYEQIAEFVETSFRRKALLERDRVGR